MAPYPFTSTGMNELTAALYALPDNDLEAEINALTANPNAWIQAKFILSNVQLTYLSGMSSEALNTIADNAALYLANRLTITLHIEEPEDGKGKWIRVENSFGFLANDAGILTPSGSMAIYVEYI